MRLLIDMNLSPRWVDALASRAIDAIHWRDVASATASDMEICATAMADDFVILTSDLDFRAILAATRGDGPSVIQLRTNDLRPEGGVEAVALAIRACHAELSAGALLTLDAKRFRITLLPLGNR